MCQNDMLEKTLYETTRATEIPIVVVEHII